MKHLRRRARVVKEWVWARYAGRKLRRDYERMTRDGAKARPICVQLGSGRNHLPGWLNTDRHSRAPYYLDALKPFPFHDGTIDYIFCENFAEHLTHREFVDVVVPEVRRVLAPWGVFRVTTPDAYALARSYVKLDHHLFEMERRYVSKGALQHGRGGVSVLNQWFLGSGHKHLYDFDQLLDMFADAGYGHVLRHSVGESSHAVLRNVEMHDTDTVVDQFMLVVEAVKQ